MPLHPSSRTAPEVYPGPPRPAPAQPDCMDPAAPHSHSYSHRGCTSAPYHTAAHSASALPGWQMPPSKLWSAWPVLPHTCTSSRSAGSSSPSRTSSTSPTHTRAHGTTCRVPAAAAAAASSSPRGAAAGSSLTPPQARAGHATLVLAMGDGHWGIWRVKPKTSKQPTGPLQVRTRHKVCVRRPARRRTVH